MSDEELVGEAGVVTVVTAQALDLALQRMLVELLPARASVAARPMP